MAEGGSNGSGRVGVGWAALAAVVSAIAAALVVWQAMSSNVTALAIELAAHEKISWHSNAGERISSQQARIVALERSAGMGDRWTQKDQDQHEKTNTERFRRLEQKINYVMKACGVPNGK